MGQATHQHADLMLRLYELRRDPRLREARDWFIQECRANSIEELLAKFPFGSKENTSFRMVTSYWDMAASLVNRGLIEDELFFENHGEAWAVYDRLRPLLPGWRESMGMPHLFRNLESMAQRLEAWREKIAPGCTEKMRERFRQVLEARAKAGKT